MIKHLFEHESWKYDDLPDEWRGYKNQRAIREFLDQSWKNRTLFYNDGNLSENQQFISFADGGIKAGKYVGTISYAGHQLNIFPKVFDYRKTKDDASRANSLSLSLLVSNLVEWLKYCEGNFRFVDTFSGLESCTDMLQLFIALYIRVVRHEIEKRPFFQYEDKREDLSTVRGKIDIYDYAIRKIPHGLNSKFSCSFSEFEFDNKLNRIIKYVCKTLFTSAHPDDKNIIRQINVTLGEVADVACTYADCDQVKLDWRHSNYQVILNMSKMFLMNKQFSFQTNDNQAYCFMFPMEKLFEDFIAGFIKVQLKNCNATVKTQTRDLYFANAVYLGGIAKGNSLGEMFALREDIFVKTDKGSYVLDTKYKQHRIFDAKALEDTTISLNDLRQIKEYALKRRLKDGWLLYPANANERSVCSQNNLEIISRIQETDQNNTVIIHMVRLPFAFDNSTDVVTMEKDLTDTLAKIFV